MQSLLAVGMFGHEGSGMGTAFQNSCSMACLWIGVFLLAVGFYLLLKAPVHKHAPAPLRKR